MSKVLLTTLNAKYIHLNLAIRILYDLNKNNKHTKLDWYEFTIKSTLEEIIEKCRDYDIICFSCYIWNITQTLTAAAALKRELPNLKIILGGPEVSYDWEPVIANDHIDYIIEGEGELPFAAFLQFHKTDLWQIPNLIWKEDGHIHYNKKQVQFDITSLTNHNPYQYEPVEDLYNKIAYIETSRGCPYKCEFCLASLDNKVRYLPMETIKSNLLYLMQHGRVIKFLDRTFNIKKTFTIELFSYILEHYRPGNVFQFEITADIVHPDIIKFIDEKVPPGLFRFEIGIQTVNKESNLAVSRKQNFEKTKKVIRALEHKIELHLDLIVGLPLEYWEDVKYSFEETFKLFAPELQLGFLKFLKGTPVREKYEQYDYEFDPNPPYQIIRSKFLSAEELHKITLVEEALEIYWNKKRAKHTLKYVTNHLSIFDFLLGLGTLLKKRIQTYKYSLKDTYQVIHEYVTTQYAHFPILLELLSIDYFTYHKVKPQDLFGVEMSKKERFEIIESQKLNHHKYRFTMLPISFNAHGFIQHQTIKKEEDVIIIQYNGREKGTLRSTNG